MHSDVLNAARRTARYRTSWAEYSQQRDAPRDTRMGGERNYSTGPKSGSNPGGALQMSPGRSKRGIAMDICCPSASSRRYRWRVVFALGVFLLGMGLEATAAQFTLTWSDNSTNESGFRIERASNGSAFSEIASVGANVVSYVDTGLANATTYSYRVRAYNSAGFSAYSNTATGTTPPLQSNSAPSISSISNRSIYAGTSTGLIPFTVGDAEDDASSLQVTVASSNTTLLPLSGIVLAGSGSNRTITATPASGRTGNSTVTVTVSDGVQAASESFVVTVNALGTGPVISAQPQASLLTPGSALSLSVGAQAVGAITYQWYLNDTPIAGATGATYTIPVAQRYHAGSYHVAVSAAGVTINSTAVSVSAGAPTNTGSLVNLSSRASVLTNDALLIPGFIVSGTGSKRFLIRMVGPGLTQFGLSGVLADPKLVLKRQSGPGYVDVATNLDWADGGAGAAMRQLFSQVGAFGLTEGSGDAAMVVDLAPGQYSVFATDEQSTRTGLSMVEVYDADVSSGTARVGNISTRGYLGTGSSIMITGFVIEDGTMTVLLRTVGPGLARFGVPGLVADPSMELVRRVDGVDQVVAANDNWGSAVDPAYTSEVTEAVSAFSLASGSRDAALVLTLPAGAYTLLSQGAGSSTGLALVEVYAVP